ncbi:hypothetical protein GIB67_029168 [Kingdonia uniflora]|uniref:Disease resistance R13L4/SHOC-2-like LRR domain-containing protein n=1 Tax=Kingdonia uniflora TaxID=39325 RepID=A0A7J7LS36_9MAGN|nr:hypothetical protein GIB67_029168 [Kingdonia uniflora]
MGNLGLSFYLCLVFSVLSVSEFFIHGVVSKTYSGDIEGLKQFKKGINKASMPPGSCLASWDFSLDPCDNIFSEHFTCGFRCDLIVSGKSRVTEITLDHPGYTGTLPSSTWNLSYLDNLDLTENHFIGSIPKSLSSLTRLRRLSLSRNSFSGEIPKSLGYLYSLEDLFLDNNQLKGRIPSSLNSLVSLKRLELQQNKLNGEFPNLGYLRNLILLDASDNEISGSFPWTLPWSIVQISMRNNQFEGNLPENFKDLGNLQVMDLSHNRLSGNVLSVFFDHPSLQQLTLSHNKFNYVQVPWDLGTNSELIAVDLSNNEIQGFLPAFMAMMPRLSALSMENNMFTGMIPTQYALKAVVPIMGVSPFVRLLLGGNYLFGPVPGPLLGLKQGVANVSLVDNCLYRCPESFFFCRGRVQKSLLACKSFGPIIP